MSRQIGVMCFILCCILVLPATLHAAPANQPQTPIIGLDYGPYRTGQQPGGPFPSAEEIQQDMELIASRAGVIRLYSSLDPAEAIISSAQANGIQVVAQAWIGSDSDANELEILAAIDLANRYDNVIGVLVGSEVMLRGDLDTLGGETKLIEYLTQVQEAVEQPVGYADILAVWQNHTNLLSAVTWVGLHSYGFWACTPVEDAADFTVAEWQTLTAMPEAQDKRVIVFETGWPSAGNNPGCPDTTTGSDASLIMFAEQMFTKASEIDIDLFLFEFADEPWKCVGGTEQTVGCHWGLFTVDRHAKPFTGRDPICTQAEYMACEGEDSQTVVANAWTAFNASDWQMALNCACRLDILWHEQADQQQVLREDECSLQPPADFLSKQAFFRTYFALADVGTAWFIAGKAFEGLGQDDFAIESYCRAKEYYSCSWVWGDGFFWSIERGANEELRRLGAQESCP